MKVKQPKRRKDKYNPYTIFEQDDKKYISFKDGQGKKHEFEIPSWLYSVLNEFELDDLSYLNEWDRHIEHSDIWESSLDKRAVHKMKSVEDIVFHKIEKEFLYEAIKKLPGKQRKRLVLYFFGGLSVSDIAKRENCTIRAVEYSIRGGIINLRKKLIKANFDFRL